MLFHCCFLCFGRKGPSRHQEEWGVLAWLAPPPRGSLSPVCPDSAEAHLLGARPLQVLTWRGVGAGDLCC